MSRPLINKTAKELSEAVERNRNNLAELRLLIGELGHRSTPSARQAAAKARNYVRDVERQGERPVEEGQVETPEMRQRRAWTHEAIAGLRSKLIDLGKRNPLVSFKHSERGATYLRIIDERPDLLFEALSEGQMRFEALPDEEVVPRDEQTDDFRIAFERARLTDAEFLGAIEGLGEEEGDAVALQAAERALRARVRQQLGLSKLSFGKTIDIASLARAHHFDPSYELRDSDDDEDAEHHRDNLIRVLLTEKQLERRLSTIHDRYRSHERETGLHTLFLVFGFAEWFEDDDSELPLHAPVLLLPVHLERSLVRGRYVFTIGGEDEDLQVNVAMRELLRQRFGLEAPELRENETPESYFIRLAGVLEQTKRFRLRRFVTLAVLPFPRMVLWQDLDPEVWPDGAFAGHDLLVRLLGAESSGGAPAFGEDYPIDDPTFPQAVPPLVTDADVSQHSALIDAAAGIPLAIEGPPGTGKSQTITNMIAGALDAGKKVLFVAEKQAALGVVAERLRALGFGPLLLELHSDRVTKASLLESLRERLDARASGRDRDISEFQRTLVSQRDQLRTYLSLLRQPLGKLGRTAHQLIWRFLNLRQGLPDDAVAVGDRHSGLGSAGSIDALSLQQRREVLDRTAQKIDEHVDVYGSVEHNPWSNAKKIETFETAAILAAARKCLHIAEELVATVSTVRKETGYPISLELDELGRQASVMAAVPALGGLSTVALRGVLQAPEAAETLAGLRQAWTAAEEAARAACSDPLGLDDDYLHQLKTAISEVTPVGLSVAQAIDKAATERARIEALKTLSADAAVLAGRFGLDGESLTTLQLREFASTLVEFNEGPEAVRAMCQPAVLENAFKGVAQGAQVAASQLTERRAAIAQVAAPEIFSEAPRDLDEVAETLSNTGFIGRLFGAEYKKQRRTAERLLPGATEREELVERLRSASKLLADEQSFKDTSPAKAYFPPSLWVGSDSDWPSLLAARTLLEGAYDRLASLDLEQALWRLVECPSIELRAPARKAAALWGATGSLEEPQLRLPFGALLEELEKGCARLEHLAGLLGEGGLVPTAVLVGGQGTIVDVIEAFREVDRKIRAQDWPSCLSWASDPRSPATELGEALEYRASLDPEVLSTLAASEQPLQLREKLSGLGEELVRNLGGWKEARSAFEAAIETDLSALFPAVSSSIDDLGNALKHLSADEAGLRLAADFQRYTAEARAQGCDFVVSLARSYGVPHGRLADLYELLVCRAVLRAYLKADGEELSRLGGLTLEAIRTRFREIDKELQSFEAQRIVSQRLADRAPWGNDTGPRGSWTEAALINNEVSKKKRHIPIRDLTKRAGQALQALKPVWMMSPSSVAQYVQPDTVTFDLVVIDEASQMRPEYATSAILRGKQLVVVGDSKQLPPTDFFQTTLAGLGDRDDADDEESVTVDTESILDLANSRIGKRRQLSWHYRSRHESLIQFSNRQFYDRRLVVFPSPSTDDPLLGVKHVYVKGTYEASINQAEAEAVIRDAIGLMIAHPECSMGIATMNIKQTELIKAEFDRLSGEHEAVRSYISAYEGGIDSFFIKNLENVQGDERDIILISTVYGPDKAGRVMQRFGPIASDVGHRRLNVLVTRAKLSTRIYTSLRSGDIKIVDGSKSGTIATQAYLTYAEGGARFDLAEGGEADSDFEVFVADRLRAAGFEIMHQVGVEKFRIDLGVRHPDYPLGFIAGIECDGARYHSGFTVRDRDKIRQSVLEGLGWKIYRVWSTDWFTDPDRQAAKLIAQVTRWRDEFISSFQARQASGEFAVAVANDVEPPGRPEVPSEAKPAPQEVRPMRVAAPPAPLEVEQGPRQVPTGRKRELDGIDWYEVETATRYEIWPDGVFGGEVEVLARATGAPQIYGGGMRIPKSEYRGSVEATGASFIEHDVYAAVRRVAQMARAALRE